MHRRIVVIISATMFLSIFAGCRLTFRTDSETGTQPKEETASEKDPAADTAIKDEESGIEIDLDEIANRLMYSKTDVEWKLPMSGCILTLPESFRSLKGQVYAYDTGETDTGSEVFHCRLFYAAASDADREALSEAFIRQYDGKQIRGGESCGCRTGFGEICRERSYAFP